MSIVWKEIGSGGSSNTPAFTLVEEHAVGSYNGSFLTVAKVYKNNGNESITIKAYRESGIATIQVIASYGTGVYTLEQIELITTETEYTISLLNPSGAVYEEFTIETAHYEDYTSSHMRIVNNESV